MFPPSSGYALWSLLLETPIWDRLSEHLLSSWFRGSLPTSCYRSLPFSIHLLLCLAGSQPSREPQPFQPLLCFSFLLPRPFQKHDFPLRFFCPSPTFAGPSPKPGPLGGSLSGPAVGKRIAQTIWMKVQTPSTSGSRWSESYFLSQIE